MNGGKNMFQLLWEGSLFNSIVHITEYLQWQDTPSPVITEFLENLTNTTFITLFYEGLCVQRNRMNRFYMI